MTSENSCKKILIVDDHEAILSGTISALSQEYPDTDICTANTAQSTQEQLSTELPDLLVMDLSIPENSQASSEVDTGIALLSKIMETHQELNIVIQSAHVRSLVRLKPQIAIHQAGFAIIDKKLPMKEMLTKVDWAIQGLIYTPRDMRTSLEIRPEWLKVLELAFKESLKDKVIAEKMNVSERTVRHYWSKVQDALDVYPEADKNIRIQTEIRAREEGLIG
ncbi:MAG: response regulator transcription factor [Cyanobacteria bacterium P01_B01_bin.77]